MGTTGTIMGVSRFLKEGNPKIQIIGVQPSPGSQIPGIRAWPKEYLPKIFDAKRVDRVLEVTQAEAEDMTAGWRAKRASSAAFRPVVRPWRHCGSRRN